MVKCTFLWISMSHLESDYRDFFRASDFIESEYGFFSDQRVNTFISLLEKDIRGENIWTLDSPLSFDVLRNMTKSPREEELLEKIIPIAQKSFKERMNIKLDSKEKQDTLKYSINALPKAFNVHTEEYYSSETEKSIRYFYQTWKRISETSVPSNKQLTEALLFSDICQPAKPDIVIDFQNIARKKDAQSIEDSLEIIFRFYQYSSNFLSVVTGFVSLLQSQWYEIPSQVLYQWVRAFLSRHFPEYLSEPYELQKSDPNLLKNPNYWMMRNLLQLYRSTSKIEAETGTRSLRVWTFSPWGSYGSIYLWQLYSQYVQEKNTQVPSLPEIYIWSSAWALYPTLFLLWKKALESNPQWLSQILPKNTPLESIDSLISLIPKWLKESDSMFMNGKKLIDAFFEVFKKLIEVINPWKRIDFESLSFQDVWIPIMVVASYEYEPWKYVPALFGQESNIKKSILVSSNPKVKILGLDVNVLSSENEIYWLKWNDGFYSLWNPIEMWYLLNFSSLHRYESFNTSERDVVKMKDSQKRIIEHNPLEGIESDAQTQWNGFDRDSAYFYSIIGQWNLEIHDLYHLLTKVLESNISWEKKQYYRDKLVWFFLKKWSIYSTPEKIQEHIHEIENLFSWDLLSEEEKKRFLEILFPDFEKTRKMIEEIIQRWEKIQEIIIKFKQNNHPELVQSALKVFQDSWVLLQDYISFFHQENERNYVIMQSLKRFPIVDMYIHTIYDCLFTIQSKHSKWEDGWYVIDQESLEKLNTTLQSLSELIHSHYTLIK